ncbi:MAG TPA: enoyl-CoA hydratase/isomerase family protein [Bacteroidetes bacterium]|nr:enoyl-CoA hydratase/isomerase family protein [Bacteroidota bacterium]
MKEYLNTELHEHYAIIEFFHPSHNSLHSGLLSKLSKAIVDIENEPSITCILLKSGGDRTFCAGANFDEMKAISNINEGKSFFMGFANVILSLKNSSKLVIGRIQGKAVGGGVGLISACDIAFSTKYASIRLSELSIGIGPFVIEPAVTRKIGLSGFTELTLNPLEWKTTEWSKEKGLFSQVFDSTELLDKYVEQYITDLSKYSPDTLKEIKKSLWYGTNHWEKLMINRAEISGRLVHQEQNSSSI